MRKVQGVPQSQTAAYSRHQEEEETEENKTSANRTNARKTPILALSSQSNAKRTEKKQEQNNTRQDKANRLVE